MNNTPVILVAYKRAWHTAQVLNSLKEHNIQNLYIFSDGPKNNDDLSGVYETRLLFQRIDWTEPTIIERDKNIGLANSIVSAVNYVLEKYDRVILLEDDCVPQKHFFDFIGTCLDKYENNEKVFGISGYTVNIPEPILENYPYDLYFFPRIGSWGWATWKRAWKHLEYNLARAYEKAVENQIDLSQGGSDIPLMLKNMMNGRLRDVWTLNWVLSVYLRNGYYIYPTLSHILNIGMDGSGVHGGQRQRVKTNIAEKKPFRIPDDVIVHEEFYRSFRQYYDIKPSSVAGPSLSPADNARNRSMEQFGNRAVKPMLDEEYITARGVLDSGNEKEGIGALRFFLALYPDYAIAHKDLGELYRAAGNMKRALHHSEKAAELQPENAIFAKNLADFYYFQEGRVEEAFQIYLKLLEADPMNLEVLLMLGQMCQLLKKAEEAKVFYKRVLELEPGNRYAREGLDKLSKEQMTEREFGIERFGDQDCGWDVIPTLLGKKSIIYCVGCGENISFDLALIEALDCEIYAFESYSEISEILAFTGVAGTISYFRNWLIQF